jgi:hypothetical protein
MGLRERFGAREPDSMTAVLDAIIESKARAAAGKAETDQTNG